MTAPLSAHASGVAGAVFLAIGLAVSLGVRLGAEDSPAPAEPAVVVPRATAGAGWVDTERRDASSAYRHIDTATGPEEGKP
ncbi:MAG TPA: hypothetical protein VGW74_08005 [Propionibacteriaceae bacterium]|nr:hypothetical protein [Propionibacteriaceae bacterium]